MNISTRKNTLKRGICIMLALVLLLSNAGMFRVRASANDLTLENIKSFYRRIIGDILTDEQLERVHELMEIDLPIVYEGGRFLIRNFIAFIETLRKFTEEILQEENPGAIVKIEGEKLVYQYHSYNTIQIGEYVFDRYHFGTPIPFETMPFGDTYYVPFFIYKGDLYIEGVEHRYDPFFVGYLSRSIPMFNVSDMVNVAHLLSCYGGYQNITRNNDPPFFVISSPEHLKTTGTNFNTTISATFSINNQWLNLSRHARNMSIGLSGISQSYTTLEQITAGDTLEYINNNLHNFSPNQGGTGVFIVPVTFEVQAGMPFYDYLSTLEPNNVYTHQPPTVTEDEIPLPAIFHNLCDDCEVIIAVDDDGNITVAVERCPRCVAGGGNGGGENPGNGGGCCTEESCVHRGLLEKILDELKNIVAVISALPEKILNFEIDVPDGAGGTQKKSWWERLTEGIGNLFEGGGNFVGSIAEGVGNGIGGIIGGVGDGAGSFIGNISEGISNGLGNILGGEGGLLGAIVNLIATLAELPVRIIEAILGMFDIDLAEIIGAVMGFFESVLDFIGGLVDTIVMLILPSPGFMEEEFGGFHLDIKRKFPIIDESREFYNEFLEFISEDTVSVGEDTFFYEAQEFDTTETSSQNSIPDRIGDVFRRVFHPTTNRFNLSIPEWGVEVNIFSLIVKVYEPVKPTVHAVIIVLVYLIFIRKCIIVVPGLINGTERAVKEPRANKK